MKQILLFTILLAFKISYAQVQNKSNKRVQLYKIWIKSDNEKVKGFLYSSNEKGITISKTKKIDIESLKFIPVAKMNTLKIRKRGFVAKSSLLGGFGGAAVGFILGYSNGDDDPGLLSFTKEEKGSILGILLAIPGGITGALLGSSKKKFLIDYRVENYLKQLDMIKAYSIEYQLKNKH